MHKTYEVLYMSTDIPFLKNNYTIMIQKVLSMLWKKYVTWAAWFWIVFSIYFLWPASKWHLAPLIMAIFLDTFLGASLSSPNNVCIKTFNWRTWILSQTHSTSKTPIITMQQSRKILKQLQQVIHAIMIFHSHKQQSRIYLTNWTSKHKISS